MQDVLSATQGAVGDYTDSTGVNDLPVLNMIGHALVGGLAAEATGGEFASGAAAGFASAVAAQSGLYSGLSADQIRGLSQVIGGVAALVAGGDGDDVNAGAQIASSGALNNYLTHAQLKEYEAKIKVCRSDPSCKKSVIETFYNISMNNNAQMQACGYDNVCLAKHVRLMTKAAVTAEDMFGRQGLPATYRRLKLWEVQKSDLRRALGNYRYNQHLATVCPGMDGGCIVRYKAGEFGKSTLKTVADFTPIVGDLKGFYDAYNSGSAVDYFAAVLGIAPGIGDGLSKLLKTGKLDNIARADFDELPEVQGLTGAQRDAAYAEFVLKGDGGTAGLAASALNRRYEPGVASYDGSLPTIGEGQSWLRGTDGNAGKVPDQIAAQLSGKQFRDFDHFREEFWKAAAGDPVLSKQFGDDSLREMTLGRAPYAVRTQQSGGRIKYELDHSDLVSKGGNVYDMNNIVVRSPLNHIERHK